MRFIGGPERPGSRWSHPTRRRGVSLLLVLGLLAIALATSYALLRTQTTAMQMQGNAGRQVDARQAAFAGLSAAIRKMHEPDWGGVDVSISGNLSANEWYEASYTTGDATLLPSSADYVEYPYRVTVTATGYAVDPQRPDARATHRTAAVVQLVRRKLSADPANWADLQQYTVNQWSNANAYVQVPVRIQGKTRLQGVLQLCTDYPSYNDARVRYLEDLESFRAAGGDDNRPFDGPLHMSFSQNGGTLNVLRNSLNLSVTNVPGSNAQPVSSPGLIRSYRLYPGGKSYTIPTIQSIYGGTLSNRTLAPDPQTNPLGLFPSDGMLTINSNVSIEGTLFSGGGSDVQIYGQNVALRGKDLPRVYGSTNRIQLPAVLVGNDFRVRDQAQGSLTGLAVVWDEFEFRQGDAAMAFDFQGRLLTSQLKLMGRDSWTYNSSTWRILWILFGFQTGSESAIHYFPQWLQANFNLQPKPLLTIRPDSSGVAYHWQDWSQPIYVADPDDGGLRWDLVRWKDNPS